METEWANLEEVIHGFGCAQLSGWWGNCIERRNAHEEKIVYVCFFIVVTLKPHNLIDSGVCYYLPLKVIIKAAR